ncbi:hypothetical protein [Campylobacter helveticus]|uniref:hypothetical protein n=1 Tax=Campylobacter helveticus TaxID=28898 RepID=UPI00104FFBC3|nr:hypothetical protein [Campylobacter helveticus]MCR2062963.1 hypothetical protein [Campylobacter helveticus]QBL11618.1 hypothetical protein A0073_03630 [Campylobacter helveticus]TNB59773.1 hypothetical protein FDR72_07505 [Campylobacter helveticus]TNH32223.1 hypothetical protein FDW46_09680 [Campylobacter helveticus]TNH34195.1 hypothetical protein FDW45_09140 [Campylobacter helveticus]
MFKIGIGEIQKNTSIFSNLKEAIQIVDKRKQKVLAFAYPANQTQNSIVEKLAGKYKNHQKPQENLETIKEKAMFEAMKEKYGLSH